MLRYIAPFLWTLLILATVEGLLEYRANRRGFKTLLFGRPIAKVSLETAKGDQVFGPTEVFPFRSRIVPREPARPSLRIWVASASHANDARVPPDLVFPNQFGDMLSSRGIDCEVLNASHPGDSLQANELELRSLGLEWKPDIVLIYQMSTDLMRSSRTSSEQVVAPRGLGAELVDAMDAFAENTTIYELLKSNVSSRITAASVLDRQLPEGSDRRFFESLDRLVETARHLGARPIVCTFCFSHSTAELPEDYKLDLLKTAPQLEPSAWYDSVVAWNQVLVEQSEIEVIDLASGTIGTGKFFRDPVHFSLAGHEHVATRLAYYFEQHVASSKMGDRE